MNIPTLYTYLVQARRALQAALEGVQPEILTAPLLKGERFQCIQDLLLHTATVEDGWLNIDLRQRQPVMDSWPQLKAERGSEHRLSEIFDYWRAVEEQTREYLNGLDETELARVVTVEDWPPEHQRFRVDGLLWHVMLHEVRHTAQIAALLRSQGIKPPSLDLLFYLPSVPRTPELP